MCVTEQLCCGFARCYDVYRHPLAAFQSAAPHSTTGQLKLRDHRDFWEITKLRTTAASENLWSVDFRPGSTHTKVLFMKLSEIWSGINTGCFILKQFSRCFHVWSGSDFRFQSICSVLNCCVVLQHLAKIEALCFCCRGLRIAVATTEQKCSATTASGSTHIDYRWNISDLLLWWSGDGPHTHPVNFGIRPTYTHVHLIAVK